MIAIFFWSALTGALTTVAAIATEESSRAAADHAQGLKRSAAQAEIQDFMSRLQ